MTKYLGIDYGTRRIGVAISNDGGTIAFPRAVLPNNVKLIETLVELVKKEGVSHVIVGDTRTVSGRKNPITEETEKFIEMLARETGVPVSRSFEGWSSIEASRYAPEGKGHDDAAAAAIILQRFLDMQPKK